MPMPIEKAAPGLSAALPGQMQAFSPIPRVGAVYDGALPASP